MTVKDVRIQQNHLLFKLESLNVEDTEINFKLQVNAIISFLNNMYKGTPLELSEVQLLHLQDLLNDFQLNW